MMHKNKFFIFLLLLTLVSAACQFSGGSPTSAPQNTNPPATSSDPLQPTFAPTNPGALPTPVLGPNDFYNSDYGVRLHYPDGWSTQPGENGYIIWFVNQSQDLYSGLWIQAAEENDTPQSIVTSVKDEFIQTFTNPKDIRDNEVKISSGQTAWTTVFSGESEYGDIKVNITATIYRAQAFILISQGLPSAYDQQEYDLGTLIESMSLEAPTLFGGIPRNQALVYAGGESTNLREYDPATTHSGGEKLVFSGLVAFDPKLNLIPDLAESWDISEDGTIYTFHLRENAKFHDGRPVTAQDFIYSWERAASPAIKSDTVLTYLGDIVGLKDVYEGKADQISGLKALDSKTLQVTIDAPKPYFLLKLTYPTGYVLDKANLESGEEWFRTPNGTGPYKLTNWERFKVIVYERNLDYYLGAPSIPYIVIRLFSGSGMRLYEVGDIDLTGVPAYDVPRVTDPKESLSKELVRGVGLCTSYIVLDVTQPPFDDPKVRQAFALAFDRENYIEAVLHGIGIPAEGLYPPGLPGYDPNLVGTQFDPERARQLLKESKYGGPDGLPQIVFTDSGFGTDLGTRTAALAKMWKQYLGVEITVENIESNKYLEMIYAGKHGQIFDTGWCADYPDPENFADALFHSDAAQNLGHYNSPELDVILEQARTERDVTKRIALYQKAQEIIVRDVPVIFTSHSLSYVLVKPYLKGYSLSPISIPLERYLWLDYTPQP